MDEGEPPPEDPDAPVADAGPDRVVITGTEVVLDGTLSTDPNGLVPLTYMWSVVQLPSGSTANFDDAFNVAPRVLTDMEGTYVFELTVANTAGVVDPTPDIVEVTAETPIPSEPVADAGPDQIVDEGDIVTLDGSASYDPDGNTPLTYDWTLVSRPNGSNASPSDPTQVTLTFTADIPGDYTFELVVCSSAGPCDQTPDPVVVSANDLADPEPIADAGADQVFTPLTNVILNGSGSYDPNGYEPLNYLWQVIAIPPGSTATLTNTTSPSPGFFADIAGDYVFELSVQNTLGQWDSTPDQVVITTTPADGFYVELTWDTDADLDLHLLDGSGGFYRVPGDVCWCNLNPDWGVLGLGTDDPSQDWDAIYGYGPETTTIAVPAAGTYDIRVHYYGKDGSGSCGGIFAVCPNSQATVSIYLGGVLAQTYQRTLGNDGDVWHVADVDWPSGLITANNNVTFTNTTDCI